MESALSNDRVASRVNRPTTQQPAGSTSSSKTTSPQQPTPPYSETTSYQNQPTTSATSHQHESHTQDNDAVAKVIVEKTIYLFTTGRLLKTSDQCRCITMQELTNFPKSTGISLKRFKSTLMTL